MGDEAPGVGGKHVTEALTARSAAVGRAVTNPRNSRKRERSCDEGPPAYTPALSSDFHVTSTWPRSPPPWDGQRPKCPLRLSPLWRCRADEKAARAIFQSYFCKFTPKMWMKTKAFHMYCKNNVDSEIKKRFSEILPSSSESLIC